MAHKLARSLSSLTAISAASLLLSTTALAQTQETAPTATDQPPAAAPAETAPAPALQPAPASALSAETATPAVPSMTTNPVVQPVPDTPAPDANQPTRIASQPAGPAPRQTTTREAAPAAPRPVADTSAPTPKTRTTTETSSSTLTRRDPAGLYTADGTPAAAATSTPVLAASRQSPYARYWPLEAAGAIVVVGLIGFAFTRRRDEDSEAQPYETLAYEAPPEPVAIAPNSVQAPARAQAPIMDTADILPAGPVPTGEARAALLEKMVAAPPDEANPFTTVKARLRRARLILSARKQALHEQATETFDWRTYKPSLKHSTLDETPVKPTPETIT